MQKITILPGCITCGLCEAIAPAIFEVTDVARPRPNAPIASCTEAIVKAATECPVQVIQIDTKESV